jgi:2',3'-cyclic-nucleotide 2'-phosphodiesterase (5'-nucleotidase family)
MIIYLLFVIFFASSCSFKKDILSNQIPKGHSELYSSPNNIKTQSDSRYKRIVIAATNDIQGNFYPSTLKFNDQHNKSEQEIQIGGVEFISSYFKVLKQKYSDILLLDSGNIFPEDPKEISHVKDFYLEMGYSALTLGIDDFNQKIPKNFKDYNEFIKDFSQSSGVPLLVNNLWDIKKAKPVDWPGTHPHLIKEMNGIKIGIIGIIPDDMISQTSLDTRKGIFLENMTQSTLRLARTLRSQGAEMIVVITHQCILCGEELAQNLNLPLSKVNFQPKKIGQCNLANSTGEWIKRLPPQLVDLIITGRTNHKTANYIGETLIMNGFSQGRGFSHAEFFFDSKTGKLNKEKTVVHQPTYFCRSFFKETNDCYSEDSTVDHKDLINAKFLGEVIKPDENLAPSLKKYLIKNNLTVMSFLPTIQSQRMALDGDLSYASGKNADSKLVALELTGKDIIDLLEKDYNNFRRKKNWYPSPFILRGDKLELLINGLSINSNAKYKIIANIKDINHHHDLKGHLQKPTTQSFIHLSWRDQIDQQDELSSAMSALNTVR